MDISMVDIPKMIIINYYHNDGDSKWLISPIISHYYTTITTL